MPRESEDALDVGVVVGAVVMGHVLLDVGGDFCDELRVGIRGLGHLGGLGEVVSSVVE